MSVTDCRVTGRAATVVVSATAAGVVVRDCTITGR